ncbi:MAG: hypothetical protein Q9203_002777 [Teloschistes exilis]
MPPSNFPPRGSQLAQTIHPELELLYHSPEEIDTLGPRVYTVCLVDMRKDLEKLNVECEKLAKLQVNRSVLITDTIIESVDRDHANRFLETAITVANKVGEVESQIKGSIIAAHLKEIEVHFH